MAKPQPITSLPRSPDDDRRERMIRYSVAMSIRLVCLIACFFTPGWWLVIPALGAIVLPYVAVVAANVSTTSGGAVQSPDTRAIVRREPVDGDPS
jgi:hypothetical protein